jgi:ribosomal protein S18 acetylase RimI-like enzyme
VPTPDRRDGESVTLRVATAEDATVVARLHADSWRRHYRGAYSDRYLDGDLGAERTAVWTERLDRAGDDTVTVIAEDAGGPVGFVHVILDADEHHGSLVDNLHVTPSRQRGGVGSVLLDAAARRVLEARPGGGVYLWVLEQNVSAQAFYRSRAGTMGEPEPALPPGGDPANMNGTQAKVRVTWPHPTDLLLER